MLFNYATLTILLKRIEVMLMKTIMSKRKIARVKTKNHVIQLCNTNNFVEKNGGDADEDYHVKEKDCKS
jgi:hypothetical protein